MPASGASIATADEAITAVAPPATGVTLTFTLKLPSILKVCVPFTWYWPAAIFTIVPTDVGEPSPQLMVAVNAVAGSAGTVDVNEPTTTPVTVLPSVVLMLAGVVVPTWPVLVTVATG